MIELLIKSLWQGKIGIRDKYIKQALENGDALFLRYRNEIMVIPNNKIRESIVAKSERPVMDVFKKQKHFLYYFRWKGIKTQPSML